MQSPLPAAVLVEAMVDYLTLAQRAAPVDASLERALTHATNQLHGAVSALTPVARERAGIVDGYIITDYLTATTSAPSAAPTARRTACGRPW